MERRCRAAVSVMLAAALVCASGLSPAIHHTHGDHEHGVADSAHMWNRLSTHWHVSWFGVELTLTAPDSQPIDEPSRVETGLAAVTQAGDTTLASFTVGQGQLIVAILSADSFGEVVSPTSGPPVADAAPILRAEVQRSAVLRI